MLDEHAVSPMSGNIEGSLDAETVRLARLVEALAPYDGVFGQRVPGLYIGRCSRINTDYVHTIHSPSLGIVAQGAKSVTVGQEVYQYDRTRMLMVPVALPVALQTTQASYFRPFLGIRLNLDPQRIAELVLKVYPQGLPPVRQWSSGYVISAELSIVNAVRRLVECIANPGDTKLIAPLIVDEILIRLLRSSIGVHVAEMGFADSGA